MVEIKTINIIAQGNEGCEHKWACNPVSVMNIKDSSMVFKYDRICEICFREELVESNRKGENIKNYRNIKER